MRSSLVPRGVATRRHLRGRLLPWRAPGGVEHPHRGRCHSLSLSWMAPPAPMRHRFFGAAAAPALESNEDGQRKNKKKKKKRRSPPDPDALLARAAENAAEAVRGLDAVKEALGDNPAFEMDTHEACTRRILKSADAVLDATASRFPAPPSRGYLPFVDAVLGLQVLSNEDSNGDGDGDGDGDARSHSHMLSLHSSFLEMTEWCLRVSEYGRDQIPLEPMQPASDLELDVHVDVDLEQPVLPHNAALERALFLAARSHELNLPFTLPLYHRLAGAVAVQSTRPSVNLLLMAQWVSHDPDLVQQVVGRGLTGLVQRQRWQDAKHLLRGAELTFQMTKVDTNTTIHLCYLLRDFVGALFRGEQPNTPMERDATDLLLHLEPSIERILLDETPDPDIRKPLEVLLHALVEARTGGPTDDDDDDDFDDGAAYDDFDDGAAYGSSQDDQDDDFLTELNEELGSELQLELKLEEFEGADLTTSSTTIEVLEDDGVSRWYAVDVACIGDQFTFWITPEQQQRDLRATMTPEDLYASRMGYRFLDLLSQFDEDIRYSPGLEQQLLRQLDPHWDDDEGM